MSPDRLGRFTPRMALASAHQRWRWPGWLGCGLLIVATLLATQTYRAHQALPALQRVHSAQRQALQSAASAPRAAASAPSIARLPDRRAVPQLLAQIEQLALQNKLGWPAADYRVTPATDKAPAALEVRCTLKGSYPQLQSFLALALHTLPGLSLRELTLQRASSTVPEVEAKLLLAVLLAGDAKLPAGEDAVWQAASAPARSPASPRSSPRRAEPQRTPR